MNKHTNWVSLRDRHMQEPGADEAYAAAKLAFELGNAIRQLRKESGLSQSQLAKNAGMTQSAIARFEAGGTVPTLPVLNRLAEALNADLLVQVKLRTVVA